MKKNLAIYHISAIKNFEKISNLDDLKNFEQNFLGKKSELAVFFKELKNLTNEEKKEIGPFLQNIKKDLSAKIQQKRQNLELSELNKKLEKDWIDVTQNISPEEIGHIHPISQVQREVEKNFFSMGFEIADGPEIETEFNNFDALNIPTNHPARDMQDTFWIHSKSNDPQKNFVLRTQTSDVQIRKMLKEGAPIKLIAPGRVFRNEDIDASHGAVFFQIEGLLIDKNISMAHLKGTLETMLSEIFEKKITIRFRPGYFPFVEPGLEVDFSCTLCTGKGCKTCKNTGWIEFCGAGMVHPNVLKTCNIDPEVYSGFAFGFGLSRLTMMKYGINDHRLFFGMKKEFLEQF